MSLSVKVAKYGNGAYMGDPGLFGDLWGGIKKVGGAVAGVAAGSGLPVISTAGRIGQRLLGSGGTPGKRTGAGVPQSVPQVIPMGAGGGGGVTLRGPGFEVGRGGVKIQMPGVQIGGGGFGPASPGTGTGVMQRPQTMPAAVNGGLPPRGYRLNKSSYFLRSGEFVPAGTRWVKTRRRNPGNMRALDRSIGRIQSAKRMAKKLGRITVRDAC